jgi:uncharacterized protein DUF4242
MCVHHVGAEGFTPEQADAVHKLDLAVQGKYSVRFLRYWYDPVTGKGFCLSEAPNREAVQSTHFDAHDGITADEIFEVFEGE